MRPPAAVGSAVLVGGFVLAEIVLAPSPRDRILLIVVFTSMTALALGVGGALRTFMPRFGSLRTTGLTVGLAAVGTTVTTVVVAAMSMFLSGHDLRLVLIALALGAGLSTTLAVEAWRTVARDLDRLSATAGRVASGQPASLTAVRRRDELGELAHAMDEMVRRLAAADRRRDADEQVRRRLLAAVGHDLRTPLTSIQAAVEALQDGIAPDPPAYLRSIASDVAALGTLVEDLFTLARLEAGDTRLEPIRVDLAEVAHDAVAAMAPTARKRGVRLHVKGNAPVGAIADPHALGRVLSNLLDNAIRHTPPGSTVRLASDCRGTASAVWVTDEGAGFPAGFGTRAFEPFTRADDARGRDGGGAGLGLAIARRLTEAQRGRMWIEPGPGACVVVELPAPVCRVPERARAR